MNPSYSVSEGGLSDNMEGRGLLERAKNGTLTDLFNNVCSDIARVSKSRSMMFVRRGGDRALITDWDTIC